MSFSGEVREELAGCTDTARHCRIAFLGAVLHSCGECTGGLVRIRTENRYAADACESCLERTMPGSCERETETGEGKLPVYCIRVKNHPDSLQLMEAVRMEGAYPDGSFRDFVVDRLLLQKMCCRKAYLRGIFLLTGSVSNPEKSYHLELVCPDLEEADLIVWLMQSLGFDPHVIGRQNHQVVYLKEGGQISDFLGAIGATNSLMKLENARIVRDIAGTVNRRVNCETANLMRTVDASVRQIRDIQYLKDRGELERLPESLKAAAELRLKLPDATLRELSEASVPPVGKSGINHRLMRLSRLAEKLRSEEG